MCCGESGIVYVWDIVDGRDHPIPMGQPVFETSPNMKMVGLVLQLTRALWSTGKAVIINSGFCVLKGLLEIRKRGGLWNCIDKNMRYWPRGVYGDAINNYFRSKYWLCGIS